VFDPLAVILLLASQYSFQWFRQAREEESVAPAYEPDTGPLTEDQIEQIKETVKEPMKFVDPGEHPDDHLETELDKLKPVEEQSIFETHPYLLKPFSHFTDTNPMVHKPEESAPEMIANVDEEMVNVAWTDELQTWKKDNPDVNIYEQQRKYNAGEIENLPWEIIEKFDEAASEESKKKSSYMIKDQEQQVKKFKE
jgi:hypothetical protein